MRAASLQTANEGAGYTDLPLPAMGETASGARWRLAPCDWGAAAEMAARLALDPIAARILAARGVRADEAAAYLAPSLREAMPDPHALMDMERAATRLASAVEARERVAIFGDYDVDGTTAAAIIKRYFAALGADVDIYIPDRMTEGYGPSVEAFRTLKARGADLVVTVDCGAAAAGPVNAAAADGLEIIVLDHHQMNAPPPAGAVAVVNPNRPDDSSSLGDLSAAGVAFMAMAALNRALRERRFFEGRPEPKLTALLDLAALGLVCDVMPMRGLTRVLTAQGLKVLGGGGNGGLKALGERAGVRGAPSAYHLGFLIGPRINAAGRIGHARLAFELLTTEDPVRQGELAEKLHILNAERQAIEAEALEDAFRRIEREGRERDAVIVVAGDGWHPGVVGIVAGRIKERYDRPAVVIGVENGVGKGSGRSIGSVDLGRAFGEAAAAGILESGGGHAMAAGATLAADRVDDFRKALNVALGDAVARAKADRSRLVDAVIAPSAVVRPFADQIARLGPFGPGNPEPQFALLDLTVRDVRIVGERHIAATLASGVGEAIRAIAFRSVGEPLETLLARDARVHALGKIKPDDWRGGEAAQLHITDIANAI